MEYIGTQKLVQRILIDKWYKNFFGHICIAKDLLELIKKKKKRFARRARERSQQ